MSDYVLNSASLADLYTDIETPRAHVVALLRGLALLDADAEVLPSLRTSIDPWAQPIVRRVPSGFISLGELVHGLYGTTDHDLAAFFDALSRSIPADAALRDTEIEAILRLSADGPAQGYEQTFSSVLAAGFDALMCAAMDFTLVGLPRSELWIFDIMGFLSGSSLCVFEHVAEASHAHAVRARRLTGLRTPDNFRSFPTMWDRMFPSLLFGLDVEHQVGKFSATLRPLLLKRLAEIDARCNEWRLSGAPNFPVGTTDIKRESAATMRRFGDDRRFRGHNGKMKTFEDHIWIDRSHRIHLVVDTTQKTIEIGYVGRHLPTTEYPT